MNHKINIAVITGGTKGIGRAIAESLLEMVFYLLVLSLFHIIGFGQTSPRSDPHTKPSTGSLGSTGKDSISSWENQKFIIQQLKELRETRRDRDILIRPYQVNSDGTFYSKSELDNIKTLMEPKNEDYEKYKTFLQQPNTGLFRLFPEKNCGVKDVVNVAQNCDKFISASDSYSFRLMEHVNIISDIRLSGEDLITDGFLSQGIIVPLDDSPLENVSLSSNGMRYLNAFKPEKESREAKKQFAQIANVVESDSYRYAKRVRAVENTNYAMRIVAYRSNNTIRKSATESVSLLKTAFLDLNDLDKRLDLALVLRIVRKDSDGSITILWKELKRQDAPKLIFQKDERLSDIKDN